jgi:hypothetical protein
MPLLYLLLRQLPSPLLLPICLTIYSHQLLLLLL